MKAAEKNNTKISQFFSKSKSQKQKQVPTPQASQVIDIEEEKVNKSMLTEESS